MSSVIDRRSDRRRSALSADLAWRALLAVRDWTRANGSVPAALSVGFDAPEGEPWIATGRAEAATVWSGPDGSWASPLPPDRRAAVLLDLYMPLCRAAPGGGRPYVVAHLGQSLDGRIATTSGASQWVTGIADITHTHRMRALADAVLVGAGTVRQDDPRLTVRRVPGRNPLRVVLDGSARLDDRYGLFRDGAAETVLLRPADAAGGSGRRLGQAELVGLPSHGGEISPEAVRACLAARGVGLLFIEGGGVTVSRFLQAGCVDRLQITVAPLIIGSGRPAISLPEIDTLTRGLRPRVRHIAFDGDVMFDCVFDG